MLPGLDYAPISFITATEGKNVQSLLDLAGQLYKQSMAKVTTGQLNKAIAFVKQAGVDYMDLCGRELVDIAIDLINGYLFCGQASSKVDMEVATVDNNGEKIAMKDRKAMVARRYITKNAHRIAALAELICSGDKSTFTDYQALAGPVPAE